MAKSLRTYIYTYDRENNDRNGNPRHYITVYRMVKNAPHLVGERRHSVGYRSEEQAVCDVILDNEPGWGKRYEGKNGIENPVQNAVNNHWHDDALTHLDKRAVLYRVGG